MTGVASAQSARSKSRGPSPKGCLLVVLAAWGLWLLVDLWRLGVFGGSMSLADAVFEMPSVGVPILFAIGLTPLVLIARRRDRRKKEFPDEPWMWEKRWNRTGARPAAYEKLAGPLVFAATATTAGGMAAVISLVILDDPLLKFAVTPFYLVGIGACVFAVNRAARVIKFRHTWFEYESFPFFLGASLSGALVGVELVTGSDPIIATLRLVQERWSGSGPRGGRTRVRSVIAEQARQYRREDIVERAVLRGGRQGTSTGGLSPALRIAFDVSADAKQTDLLAEPAFRWELQVTARRPGLDFDVTFLLPVYAKRAPTFTAP